MIATTLAELAELLDTPLTGDGDPRAEVTAVVVDSRLVEPGCLFVALPGERVDGHDYVEQAWRDGAVAAVTARPVSGRLGGDGEPGTGCCLVVADPLAALGRIGRLVVDKGKRFGLRVVGITGSQGKTSTKDLLAQILATAGETVAPQGSFNNEIGVPLTASRIRPSTRFLISEMGARGRGHIAYLCGLTPPGVGAVLNVGSAHLGMFGSRQAIAQAKGELVESLPPDGVAVLNLTDPLVATMAERTAARRFGFCVPGADQIAHAEVEVVADDPRPDAAGRWGFSLRFRGASEPASGGREEPGFAVQLQLLGRHQIGNALAAAAAAYALGIEPVQIAAALTSAELRSHWRMEVSERADGLLLVNDAYNANPASMAAALDTLAELGTSRRRNHPAVRTVAVLGDMLELGESSPDEHSEVGRRTAELGIDRLLVVGADAQSVVDGAVTAGYPKEKATMFSSISELAAALSAEASPSDVVLLKASRSIGLEVLADRMLSTPAGESDAAAVDAEDRR